MPYARIATICLAFLCLTKFAPRAVHADDPFRRDNVVAWCIVPFDDRQRSPEQRAEMLDRLGIRKYAYDYRAEHVAQFDAEMEAIKRHGIELVAWWFPGSLNDEARHILDVLKRHDIKTQLWITGGGANTSSAEEQQARVKAEADRIRPIAMAAAEIGCSVGLYNHGGWFGEPENQIAIIEELKLANVGIVYNLHHGHGHLDRFAELLAKMRPFLYVLNLNGMFTAGDQIGQKIVPIGQGPRDVEWMTSLLQSGYDGPIGILNHTQRDAEARLQDNLDGLRWLVAQAREETRTDSPRPQPRTWQPPADVSLMRTDEQKLALTQWVQEARLHGDARRGAAVFATAKFACHSCHRIGQHGGQVGPELTQLAKQQTMDQIAASVLWPREVVKPEYRLQAVVTSAGAVHRGYVVSQDPRQLTLRDPATQVQQLVAMDEIEETQDVGTLMPTGLWESMTPSQRADLLAFLGDLGPYQRIDLDTVQRMLSIDHSPAKFTFDRQPLNPQAWPHWQQPVNRDRVYDYYAKQARYFRGTCPTPQLIPEFPGLDGGSYGHWGNQSEPVWADARWNNTDLGTLQAGVFHGNTGRVTRGVCVRVGEGLEAALCFDPDRLVYTEAWEGGFLQFSDVRHGFMHGLKPAGKPLALSAVFTADGALQVDGNQTRYLGYYRFGPRVLFSYMKEGVHYLDAPWFEDGQLQRVVAPADQHPYRNWLAGGAPQWPNTIATAIRYGSESPYTIDTIELPHGNPWKALLFCGDHAFLPDGSAVVCTMQGDVWRVEGLQDRASQTARWRRIASGLHHALGMVTEENVIYVLGRDQLTRLEDVNGDGEIDFYGCHSNAYVTSPSGHDFICGLWRDPSGQFYTASGNQGLLRLSADGRTVTVLAEGFRNPDGLGLLSDGTVTVPSSEGDWMPASMICAIKPTDGVIPFFGRGGPRGNEAPAVPMLYLPRGLDNSSGGQAEVTSDHWGPLQGQLLHFSYGAASHFLVLRDQVGDVVQGAAVQLPGEFKSGAHRGRFNPHDGQLYVSGMGGWGTYSVDDGCFQRVRYTGDQVQLPIGFHAHENGIHLRFTQPLDPDTARDRGLHFAQSWNYRYSGAYGSPEYSSQHLGLRGHDCLEITAAVLDADQHGLFLEIPELQPVNQLHLCVESSAGQLHDLFMTINALDAPFKDYPTYQPNPHKVIAVHPLLQDMARARPKKRNPWEKAIAEARVIDLRTADNLTFAQPKLMVTAGEPIQLNLINPDVVPHNWALLKPGTLAKVGELTNRLIADPEAASNHYVPQTDDVLVYTEIVEPHARSTIYFRAPESPGRYPFLCTFPGHWMVMNGEVVVEAP